jgi:hypothetical protein
MAGASVPAIFFVDALWRIRKIDLAAKQDGAMEEKERRFKK